MSDLRISNLEFSPAPPGDRDRGLLCFVSFTIDGGLQVDGVALRKTRYGQHVLAFPRRRDRRGRVHDVIRPVNQSVRDHLTRQVMDALGVPDPHDAGAVTERPPKCGREP